MEKYIHFTSFNINTIESILKNGIKSKSELKKIGISIQNDIDFNGDYFISLTKENSSFGFKKYYNDMNYIGVVVNKPKRIYKANPNLNDILYDLFNNSKLPIRYSAYPDEWQTKNNISTNDIVALKYRIKHFSDIETVKKKLIDLKNLITSYDIDLPIIDFDTNKVYKIEAK